MASLLFQIKVPRAISIPRTVYGQVGESFADPKLRSIVWLALDQPASAPYMPLVQSAGEDSVGEAFRVGNRYSLDRRSAWWAFNIVANQMQLYFRLMDEDVQQRKTQWQHKLDSELREICRTTRDNTHGQLRQLGQHRTTASVIGENEEVPQIHLAADHDRDDSIRCPVGPSEGQDAAEQFAETLSDQSVGMTSDLEGVATKNMPSLSARLAAWQNKKHQELAKDYFALADELSVKYLDGTVNTLERLGKPFGVPAFWLEMSGQGNDPKV